MGLQEQVVAHIQENASSESEDFILKVEEAFETTIDGFVAMGNSSVDVLVGKMIQLIEESLIKDCFTDAWLADAEHTIMRSVVATLNDYFSDFKAAIASTFYLSKIVPVNLVKLILVDEFMPAEVGSILSFSPVVL